MDDGTSVDLIRRAGPGCRSEKGRQHRVHSKKKKTTRKQAHDDTAGSSYHSHARRPLKSLVFLPSLVYTKRIRVRLFTKAASEAVK